MEAGVQSRCRLADNWPAPPAPSPPAPPLKEGRLHTLKLVLEIIAVLVTIIGGIIALAWRFR